MEVFVFDSDEQVISLQRTIVYVITDSVLCLGKIHENLQSNTAWEQRLECFKTTRNTEHWTQLTESRWNSSGIFPKIHHIAAHQLSPRVHDQNGRPITIQRKNHLHVDVQ